MKFLRNAAVLILVVVALAAGVFFLYPLWVADERVRLHLWQAGVKSEYVVVDTHRLHFFEALPTGPGPGKPLLLIHGLGSHGEDWSPLIPTLAAHGYHVYAPDLLGYGRSDRPDVDYSITTEVASVAHFMDTVGLKQASALGVSMGGWVAMKLALDQPARVDRLLLYDSAGTRSTQQLPPSLFTPRDEAGVNRLVALLYAHPPVMPAFVARDALRKLHRNAWIVDRATAQMKTGRDLVDAQLHAIHQPTLIVWGSNDALIPLAAGRRIHEGISGSVLEVMDGCGHVAGPECWKREAAITLDFLAAQPPPSGGEHHLPPD